MQLYIAVVVCAVAVLQSYAGSMAFCVAAVMLAPVLFARREQVELGVAGWPLLALALWQVVASIVSGFSAETLAAAALPLAAFVLYMALRGLSAAERRSLATSLCFLSCIVAFVGFVAYALFPAFAWVSGKHLLYCFYDADVSALWFAAMTLLGMRLVEHNRFLVLAVGVNVAALLLTCSVLVVGVALVLMALLLVLACRRRRSKIVGSFYYAFVGMAFAVAFYFCKGIAVAQAIELAAFVLLLWFVDVPVAHMVPHKVHYALAGVVTVAVVVGCVFSMRLQQELPLIVQIAMTQVVDAASCIAARPVFGVGAGQWGYVGYQFQSTVYSGSLLPASTLQFAVEGGVVALVALVAFVVVAVIGTMRRDVLQVPFAVLCIVSALCFPALQYFAFFVLFFLADVVGAGLRPPAGDDAQVLLGGRAAARPYEDPAAAGYDDFADDTPGGVELPVPACIASGVVALVAFAFVCIIYGQTMYMQLAAQEDDNYSLEFANAFSGSPYWVVNSPSARAAYEQVMLSVANGDLLDGEEAMAGADELLTRVNPVNEYDVATQGLLCSARYDCDAGVTLVADEIDATGTHSSKLFSTMQTLLNSGYVSDDVGNRAVALGEAYGYEVTFTPYTDEEIAEHEEAKQLNDSILEYMAENTADDSDSGDSGDAANGESAE